MIRDARPDDAFAISRVQARSWAVAYRGIAPDEFLDGLTDDVWEERWREALGQPPRHGAHRLVAVADDGGVVGIAACGPAVDGPGATGQLYVLYVLPEHWGEGHGAGLLREVHARLGASGFDEAVLWVAADNARTIAIYAHLGWHPDGGVQSEELHGVTFEEIRLRRPLP